MEKNEDLSCRAETCQVYSHNVACENIRFSSLFTAGDVSRGGTPSSLAAKSGEKRMFSQATHNAKETCIKFPAIGGKKGIFCNFWWRPEVTGHYKNIPPPYRRGKLLDTAGNLEVNEQSKYKSVPVFFYS